MRARLLLTVLPALRLAVRLPSVRRLAVRRGSRRARVFQPLVERVAFDVEDLFELVLDVLEDRAEVEAVELLTTLLADQPHKIIGPTSRLDRGLVTAFVAEKALKAITKLQFAPEGDPGKIMLKQLALLCF